MNIWVLTGGSALNGRDHTNVYSTQLVSA
jgi:hypothetical protein